MVVSSVSVLLEQMRILHPFRLFSWLAVLRCLLDGLFLLNFSGSLTFFFYFLPVVVETYYYSCIVSESGFACCMQNMFFPMLDIEFFHPGVDMRDHSYDIPV